MARNCSICRHANRTEIEKNVINGETLRDIAGRFGVSRSAVQRHKNHLAAGLMQLPLQKSGSAMEALEEKQALQAGQAEALAAEAQARLGKENGRARDVMAELERCFSRANLLLDACDRWLRDPEDPGRYDLSPRADDIYVVFTEPGEDGIAAVRRRKKLSVLLEDIRGRRPGSEIVAVETKSADIRKLVLDSIAELRQLTGLQLSIFETLNDIRQVAEFQEEVLSCIGEISAEVRERILQKLQARRGICSIVS
jgi:hypothetical protein